MIKFGVACSTNWDPKVAGVEATVKALEQVNYKPKFLLIFCTIHYAKEKDGLKKLLAGCRSLVEDDVPSIGGTVTGFICQEGCHTRGVVVVASSGEDMTVFGHYEKGVMKSPSLVGKKIAKNINEQLSNSRRKNGLIIEFMSGPIEPMIMTYDTLRYIAKKLPSRLLWLLRDILIGISNRFLHYGPGMEEDVLLAMNSGILSYYLVGCSTFDDFRTLDHYQFYNDRYLKDSFVGFAISLDDEIIIERKLPLIPTGKKFKIKRGWNNFTIDKIGGNDAVTQYLSAMGWPKEYEKIHVKELIRETFYHPLAFKRDNLVYPFPAGFFFGDTIATNRKIRSNEIELFLTSGKETIKDFSYFMQTLADKKTQFTLIFEGMDILGILGERIGIMKKMMDETIKDAPYLILFGSGEHSKKTDEKPIFCNYSMVMLSLLRSDQ